jgi:hypothetical protein
MNFDISEQRERSFIEKLYNKSSTSTPIPTKNLSTAPSVKASSRTKVQTNIINVGENKKQDTVLPSLINKSKLLLHQEESFNKPSIDTKIPQGAKAPATPGESRCVSTEYETHIAQSNEILSEMSNKNENDPSMGTRRSRCFSTEYDITQDSQENLSTCINPNLVSNLKGPDEDDNKTEPTNGYLLAGLSVIGILSQMFK